MAWLTNWTKRREIIIDNTKIDADLTYFAVLLKLGASVGLGSADITSIFDEVGANSQKIAITKSDGETQIYADVRRWDAGNEVAEIYVSKSDLVIDDDTDTVLYIYYDNSQDNNTDYIGIVLGSSPATNVWDSNFIAGWSMEDLTSSSIKDFTGNGIDLTKKGADEPAEDTGKVVKGQHFDNSDDYAKHATFLDTMPAALTGEFWFSPDVLWQNGMADRDHIFEKINDLTANSYDWLSCRLWTDGSLQITNNRNHNFIIISSTTVSWAAGGWFHIMFKVGSGGMELWVNGVSQATNASTQLPSDGTAKDFALGIWGGSPEGGTYYVFDGLLDEMRFSDIARTVAYAKARYNTENDTLLTWGSEEGGEPQQYSVTATDTTSLDDELWKSQGFKLRLNE